MKVEAQISSEPQLEYNQGQTTWWIKVVYDRLNQFGSYINMQFEISPRRENRQENTWVIKFLEKSFAKKFALSDTEYNTSGPLNRGDTADLLLSRTLFVTHQQLWEPRFWKIIDSLVWLASASLTASRTLPQWISTCLILLNFWKYFL